MNFDYDFNSSNTLMDVRMMPHHHHNHHHHAHQAFTSNLINARSSTSSSHTDDLNGSSHTFDCLMNEVDNVQVDCIANEGKSDEETDRFDLINQANTNQLIQHQNQQQQKDLNSIQQLQAQQNHLSLNDNIGLKAKQINRTSNNANACSNIEKNFRFETTTSNKFHYVLMAPTSPAVKANEETLTYLNQGQNYELRINRVTNMFNSSTTTATVSSSSSSFINESRQVEDIKPLIVDSKLTKNANDESQTMNRIVCGASDSESTDKLSYHNLNESSSNCSLYLSIVRVCFWDRKLQEIEHEEIKEWKKEYANMRMLEIDNTSSFGTVDIRLSEMFTNAAEVIWSGKTGASVFFRCNCTSTAFAPNKHGGEKGIHMRFQVDTYELLSSSMKYQSNLVLNNYYQTSNLSPSNSSSISSSSSLSSSSSSFLSQDLKLAKDDFDCMSSSEFKNLKEKEQENFRSPSPVIDYSTGNYWKHLCSSYCRIQLFRLKGAQRKLKTDKSKVERLNPPDLRKRYQPSNKVTVLSNSQFDSLYSLLPFSRYANSNNTNTIPNATGTPDGSIDTCLNMMDNRSLSIDYTGLNNPNTSYYVNNSLSGPSHSMLGLYNGDATSSAGLNAVNNYAIQPILVVQQQQQQLQTNLQLNKPKQNDLAVLQTNELSKVQLLQSSSSMPTSSASSTSSQDDSNYFLESNPYYDSNSTKTLQSDMSTSQQHISLVNSTNEDNSANYNDELVYTRLKRASSISSINSNASYGSNGNYNYKNTKFQKTSSMSSVPAQNKYINLSPSFNPLSQQYQQTSQQQLPQSILISTTNNSNQQMYTQQSMSPSSKPAFIQDSKMNQFSVSSPVGQLESANAILYKSKILPNDCNFKYVQEWLIANRFGHLLHLFANYTSNDLLRLSKEDMISLCGAPDGIRCFNVAHNIQIKPKLTIFVTFQNQTYFSAVFLADWKSKFLIQKLLSLYTSFVTNLTENKKLDESDDSDESDVPDTKNEPNDTITSSSTTTTKNETHSPLNNSEMNSDKTEIILEHQQMYEKMCNTKLDYELFLKIKDILVQTTDEVLNNLSDQSRFLVKFEMPTNISSSNTPIPSSPTTSNISSPPAPPPPPSNDQSKFALNKSIKILMIPLD